jgi:hypothetical protein
MAAAALINSKEGQGREPRRALMPPPFGRIPGILSA